MVNPDRPQWAQKLRFWLTDDLYQQTERRIGKAHDGAVKAMHVIESRIENGVEHLETLGLWALCRYYGHEPVADQCDKPEHDFCVYCSKKMPDSAPRPPR